MENFTLPLQDFFFVLQKLSCPIGSSCLFLRRFFSRRPLRFDFIMRIWFGLRRQRCGRFLRTLVTCDACDACERLGLESSLAICGRSCSVSLVVIAAPGVVGDCCCWCRWLDRVDPQIYRDSTSRLGRRKGFSGDLDGAHDIHNSSDFV